MKYDKKFQEENNTSEFNWLWKFITKRNVNSILKLSLSLDETLDILPDNISKLTNLHSLNLNMSNVKVLPESIGELRFLRKLELKKTLISTLPSSIGNLEKLNILDLNNSMIKDLPETIVNLKNLTYLDLSYSQITELPQNIGDLINLKFLDLRGTKISVLPESIGALTELTFLGITNTNINELPYSIVNLKHLSRLDLGHMNISKLPENVGELYNLKSLNLSFTKIQSLPNSIMNLKKLEFLSLHSTPISLLPDVIYELPIKILILTNLKLETISSKILDLNLPFLDKYSWHITHGIYLEDTEIAEFDVKVFSYPREEIKTFFVELEKNRIFLNEARTIFVGNGSVGKSTIINQMITNKYADKLPETRGIQLKTLNLKGDFTIRFWDFGGQAIMHSMHRFFLSQRCLYVLVLDGRKDENPEDWLDLISQYGYGCPVLIVMNKTDESPNADIDMRKVRRDYIKKFRWLDYCRISCKYGKGFNEFKDLFFLGLETLELSKKTFPKSWNNIRNKLLSMPGNYINEAQYKKYCCDNGILNEYAQNVLLSWMNDLGICFSYQGNSGIIEDTKVLRPEWVINGVYKILMAPESENCHGFLSNDIIRQILERENDVNDRYHNIERDFVVEMMRKFKLSYTIGSSEFIPMLAQISEPELPDLNNPIRFELAFNHCLSESVLHQFIVEMKADVQEHLTWRYGTFLHSIDNSNGVVRFYKNRHIIEIITSGNTNYLSQLRNKILKLINNLNIQVKEYIYYNVKNKEAKLELGRLLKMFRHNKVTDYADDIEEDVNICDVLSYITPIEVINALKKQYDNKKISDSNDSMAKDILFMTSEIKNQLSDLNLCVQMITNNANACIDLCKKIQASEKYRDNSQLNQILIELLEEMQQNNQRKKGEKLLDFLTLADTIASLANNIPSIAISLAQLMGNFSI